MRYVMGLILMAVTASGFAQAQPKAPPLAERLKIYEQLAYMTQRDFAELTPEEQHAYTCIQIGEKIDIQLDYEKHGSHGIYNMDALRHAGPEYCRAYLMSIH
ncbi:MULTISPECIES: hypothetical protein [unclassified Rhodanobacter]|uniref:hypothetical protein n=1 Tax=unclassified Rhodanobacter TaxID=2621553 RepID=UPI001BDEE80B|nr:MULTISPECIES: hypothetical protein [unclassified Rhodanobacter]MBT2142674.1 hypothetical protein [Rhodanobacter sp. LX-99]MBT2148253.1 hypothetical protein [Rhodanobacter sp. LX-100]